MGLRAEHYKHYIEDQSENRLTMHVLRLKKEKTRLIREIEARHYGKPEPLRDHESQRIQRYRWYIEDTLSALEATGKVLGLDVREKSARQFQEKIPLISQVIFYLRGYLGGLEKYDLRLDKDYAYITYSLSDTTAVPPMILMEPDYLSKKEFLAFIHSLHMGEWESNYTARYEDYLLFDSMMWSVEVHYSDGSKMREYSGLNAFPYNFSQFLHFFESYKKTVDKI